MDTVTKAVRSRIMSRIKSKNTLPERLLFRELERRGLKFERHSLDLPGKPDVVVRDAKIAMFVDGCFFHGCPVHGTMPKSNRRFWAQKITANRLRDIKATAELMALGYTVHRFWECVIKELYA